MSVYEIVALACIIGLPIAILIFMVIYAMGQIPVHRREREFQESMQASQPMNHFCANCRKLDCDLKNNGKSCTK